MSDTLTPEKLRALRKTPCSLCGRVKASIMIDPKEDIAVCHTCADPRKKGGCYETHAKLWPGCPIERHDAYDHIDLIL